MPLDEKGADQLLDAADGDFVFKLGEPTQRIRADSFILRKFGSEYFRKMFEVHMLEQRDMEVTLSPDWSPEAFRVFLRYVYCHRIDFALVGRVVSDIGNNLGWFLSELLKIADYCQYGRDSEIADLGAELTVPEVAKKLHQLLDESLLKVSDKDILDRLCEECIQGPSSLKPFIDYVEKLLIRQVNDQTKFKLMCFGREYSLDKLRSTCRARVVKAFEKPTQQVNIRHILVNFDSRAFDMRQIAHRSNPSDCFVVELKGAIRSLLHIQLDERRTKASQQFSVIFEDDNDFRTKFSCKRSTWIRSYFDCISALLEDSMPELEGICNTTDKLITEHISDFEKSIDELARLKLTHEDFVSHANAKIEALLVVLEQSGSSGSCLEVDKNVAACPSHNSGDTSRLKLAAEAADKASALGEERLAAQAEIQLLKEALSMQIQSHEAARSKLSAEADERLSKAIDAHRASLSELSDKAGKQASDASKHVHELEVKLAEADGKLQKASKCANELEAKLVAAEERANMAERGILGRCRDWISACAHRSGNEKVKMQ